MKKLLASTLIAAVLLLFLAACNGDSGSDTAATNSAEAADMAATTEAAAVTSAPMVETDYTDNDLSTTWDEASAVAATLERDSVAVSGSGATADGSTLTITAAGTYVVSGSLNDGQIVVDAGSSDKVWVVLDGADISCSTGPGIYIKSADKVFLTLAEGSENAVTDGSSYTLAEGEDEPNAAIFSKDDLTINGTGSLAVSGNYSNGILSKDDLVITNGVITVDAVADGIRGRDCVAICGGTITVDAGSDGIQSNNDTDETVGWVSIDGGSLSITTENGDGIQAQSVLQVTEGDLTISTGGGSGNTSSGDIGYGWGNIQGAEETSGDSVKGLKAGISLYITGGALDIDALDDSVHTNGTAEISGGAISLASGDDGVHANGQLLISAGTVSVTKSYEGLEGIPIIISGGDIRVTASDDGLNAAGDDDSATAGTVAGPQGAMASSEDCYIKISGGLVIVSAGGDGIDSNRDFYMEGGTVLVDGPTDGANGALDIENSAQITGGTFVAAGSSGMAMNFGSSSTQAALMVNYSSAQAANTLLTLLDESGNVIASYAPSKNYQSIIISTPDMQQGGTYTLYTGGSTETAGEDGLYTGTYTAGTEVVSVTLDSVVTSISDTGTAISGGTMPQQDGTMPQQGGTMPQQGTARDGGGASA